MISTASLACWRTECLDQQKCPKQKQTSNRISRSENCKFVFGSERNGAYPEKPARHFFRVLMVK